MYFSWYYYWFDQKLHPVCYKLYTVIFCQVIYIEYENILTLKWVHLVLHPLGACFIPIISTKGINQVKKGNCKKKKVLSMQKGLLPF